MWLEVEIARFGRRLSVRLIDWLIDWLINWLTDRLIDWLITWLTDRLIDWLIVLYEFGVILSDTIHLSSSLLAPSTFSSLIDHWILYFPHLQGNKDMLQHLKKHLHGQRHLPSFFSRQSEAFYLQREFSLFHKQFFLTFFPRFLALNFLIFEL